LVNDSPSLASDAVGPSTPTALHRHESLHLLRHRPRVQIMHDEQPRRLVDDSGMRRGQQLRLLRRVETRLRLLQLSRNLGIIPMPPIVVDRRKTVPRVIPEHRRRIYRTQADVDPVHAMRLRRLRIAADGHLHGAPFHDIELDLYPHRGTILLNELIHRDRQHLPGPRRRDHDFCLHRLARPITGLLQQGLRLLRIVRVFLRRVAEERMPGRI
jgi:hypothetical protein